MSDTVCIDASVAAKWVLTEDDSELANSLLDQAMRDRTRLTAPPHLVAEVTSAIYRRLRLGYLAREEAIEGVTAFADVPFDLLNPPGVSEKAIELGLEFGWKDPYDALYLAVGELLDCDVWTADREFFDDAHETYPRLHLLSELA